MTIIDLIDKLYRKNTLSQEELITLIKNIEDQEKAILFSNSQKLRKENYGRKVFARALLEISSYCQNSCLYCGINKNNPRAKRYRLSEDEILKACHQAYQLGYRTFVLQGGEDAYYTDSRIERIVYSIKSQLEDVRVTLSLGEKDYNTYKKYYQAGADRYLLRHETADRELFKQIHPNSCFEDRAQCLYMLKDIGYQIGAGFMVGIPGQTDASLAKDLIFLKELNPQMVGLGPFIPHKDTVFRGQEPGTIDKTILMLSLVRNLLPEVLLPATTALSTIDKMARQRGIEVASNVIMPNISPSSLRKKYSLYDNKASFGLEGGEELSKIKKEIGDLGFELDMSKGDHIRWVDRNDR